MKKFIALLLTLAMLAMMLPGAFAAGPDRRPQKELDYTQADALWEQIDAREEALLEQARPNSTGGTSNMELSLAAEALVLDSDAYVDGSLERSGSSFTWMTTSGVACRYSPRLRNLGREAVPAPDYDPAAEAQIQSISYGTRGGVPGAKDVYLIEPYYGIDSSFEKQYQTEAKSIAQALGGTYYLYSTTNATIDNIAKALESGAVVIFDSHGDTDYANPNNENDFTSKATTSYLCLQSGTGITSADYADGHAYYGGSGSNGMKYYEVDGTAIANHITGTCPNNFLWMAICLGMATDGLQAPLRAKGVEAVYGYSQSVTFFGDYCFEKAFWNQMKTGATVADAIATMKSTYGNWDFSSTMMTACGYLASEGYATISEARANYAAFPIVVSSEDAYPGHGKVDALQTVRSTYKLSNEPLNPVEPEPELTQEQIVEAAYALGEGQSLEGTHTLTGTITRIVTPYSKQYQDITVEMVVGDMTDKPIQCYQLIGSERNASLPHKVADLKVGDIITVEGTLKNYKGTVEFDRDCRLIAKGQTITALNFADAELPKVGETGFTTLELLGSTPTDAVAEVSVEWYQTEVSGADGTLMAEGETFQEGKLYYGCAIVTPREGYSFLTDADGYYAGTLNCNLADDQYYVGILEDGSMYFFMVEFTPEQASLLGDANNDGTVNLKDVAYLRIYLANLDPATGNSNVEFPAGGDMDGNGAINMKDLISLRQYLANSAA